MREFSFQHTGSAFRGETVRFFGTTLPLSIMGESGRDTPTPRQLEMIDHIETLNDAGLREDIWRNAIVYCKRVDSIVELDSDGITIDYKNIGQHFRAICVIIPQLDDFAGNIFLLHYDCDWESEHGMQLVIEDGRVISCSSCDGLAFSGRYWLAYLKLSPEERMRQLQDTAS